MLTDFGPGHLLEEIGLIEKFQRHFPDLPQVASLDTAFHRERQRVAQLPAITRRCRAQGGDTVHGGLLFTSTFQIAEQARLYGAAA